MALLEPQERALVRRFLTERFDLAELKSLAFDLGVSYDELPHTTRNEFCRELIAYFERRGNVGCLLVEVARQRPDEEIARLLAVHGACVPREKVVVLAPAALRGKLDAFLQRFAAEYGLSPDDVQLLATAPGSIQLLLGLPAPLAERLLRVQPATLGGYPIHAIMRFGVLPPATQEGWRAAALRGEAIAFPAALRPVAAAGGAATEGMSALGKLLALLALLLVAGAAVLYVAVPRLVMDNQCGRAFPLGQQYPVVGSEIASGRSSYWLPPGTWEVTYTGEAVGLTSSLVSFPPLRFDVPMRITVDGTELAPRPEPFEQHVGLGTETEVMLCPDK